MACTIYYITRTLHDKKETPFSLPGSRREALYSREQRNSPAENPIAPHLYYFAFSSRFLCYMSSVNVVVEEFLVSIGRLVDLQPIFSFEQICKDLLCKGKGRSLPDSLCQDLGLWFWRMDTATDML